MMERPGGLVLFLLLVLGAAILLDGILLWVWRALLQRRAGKGTSLTSRTPRADHTPDRFLSALQAPGRLARSAGRSLVHGIAIARQELPTDDLGRLRLSVVAACLLLNASIGYAYADRATIEGWQLWTWLMTIAVAAVCLLPKESVPVAWNREAWIVVSLTVVGAGLRLFFLGSIPPGLHPDESLLAEVSLRFVFSHPGETLHPLRTGIFSQPTLFNYILWASMKVFGENAAGLRTAGALAGTLAIPACYLLVSALSGKRVGLIGAVLLTAYHFHIHWSRLALNNIWDTLWIPAILALFIWAWRSGWSGAAVACGLALGLSQYFYAGSRLGILLLVCVAFALWRQEGDTRRLLVLGGKALAAAAVVAIPLAVFALRQPEPFFDRFLSVLFWRPGWVSAAQAAGMSWFQAVFDQFFRASAGFTSLIETTGFYRPNVPLVAGLAAPLLLAGLIWAVWQREFLPVIWLGLTMFFGGFAMTYTPSSPHYVAAIPAVVWLVALPIEALGRLTRPWIAWGALAAIVAFDLFYYFGVYIPAAALWSDLRVPFPPGPF